MKNPPGYGTIFKLGGNRRKPYCVRKTIGYKENGSPIYEYIGYCATQKEAQLMLWEYNLSPSEKAGRITFGEVYEEWSEKHFPTLKKPEHYINAYNKVSTLYKVCLCDITQKALQDLVDHENTYSTAIQIKSLFLQVFGYAEKQNYITHDQNRVEYLDTPPREPSKKHMPFTNDEIALLWEHKNDFICQVVLTLIYTGARPMELFNAADLTENSFKVENGKTKNAIREVPIHESIKPYIKSVIELGINDQSKYNVWVRYHFKPKMKELGLEHDLYDTRHTFATMWANEGLNEMYRRFIQGHTRNGIGEQVYTHIPIETLKKEVDKLPIKF